jgi:hypothetical protein
MQIASAINKIGGGVNFKPGAKLNKFASGGFIGDSLSAPIFTPASTTTFVNNSGGISEEKFDELIDVVKKNNDEQSKRIDRMEVYQVTKTVTNAQKKQAKQSDIATL